MYVQGAPWEAGKNVSKIHDITFKNIVARNSSAVGNFLCAANLPCTDIRMINVTASSASDHGMLPYRCENAYGTAELCEPKPCLLPSQ
jgi:hypothetical protein